MARAYSVANIYNTKHELVQWAEPWKEAFGEPAVTGVWFVWGNSGNAKTRFMLELAQELSKTKRVFYDSLEEGKGHTMQLAMKAAGIDQANRNLIIGSEPVNELEERLGKRKSPQVVVIDSIQYTSIRFAAFLALVHKFPNVLFIINSQADGKHPAGKVAKQIKYDAALKIWVEGYQAISNGRYNPGGVFEIWRDGAKKYGSIENDKKQAA